MFFTGAEICNDVKRPMQAVWIISFILEILGIIVYLMPVPIITGLTFWLMTAVFVLLVLGTALKGF